MGPGALGTKPNPFQLSPATKCYAPLVAVQSGDLTAASNSSSRPAPAALTLVSTPVRNTLYLFPYWASVPHSLVTHYTPLGPLRWNPNRVNVFNTQPVNGTDANPDISQACKALTMNNVKLNNAEMNNPKYYTSTAKARNISHQSVSISQQKKPLVLKHYQIRTAANSHSRLRPYPNPQETRSTRSSLDKPRPSALRLLAIPQVLSAVTEFLSVRQAPPRRALRLLTNID
ncbi:hypothetical protein DFH09DRAFT_1096248 [Mycena vulgaris]|nr:hypothetical protein DFH09DRAFT_1096248 [Mycena vulgaris]